MSKQQDDLDLLLSLQDRILETPPASPSPAPRPHPLGHLSDGRSPNRVRNVDMSVFRDSVRDYLDEEPESKTEASTVNRPNLNAPEVEKFSGLRVRNPLVSPVELNNRFSEIRFVRLPTIKNVLTSDTLSGCWATVGVLTEKGNARTSSTGKGYCIWKFGCLDEMTVSTFLFGDAYQKFGKEQPGATFALFNCNVRKDAMGSGFSLSIYNAGQMLKMGTSVDYGVCKGKRKDGMACTLVINKRQGVYCKYHRSKSSEKYSTKRTELMGSNLRTAFKGWQKSEGIHLVDPLADKTNLAKASQPIKVLSVEGLKKALSNAADKMPANGYSQGMRFLTQVTGKSPPRNSNNENTRPNKKSAGPGKRLSSITHASPLMVTKNEPHLKRKKVEQGRCSVAKIEQKTEKMIELDYVSSDEDL